MKRKTADRRSRPRFEIVGDLWGAVEVTARLEVVNAGRGGALLASPLPLAPDSVQSLTILADGERHRVSALVRHSRAGAASGYLVGVEFLDLPDAVASVIEHYIDAAQATRRGAVGA